MGGVMEITMSALRDAAMKSKAWPFEEARALLKRYEKKAPEKGYVLFETGYGPSGLPHIGTFGEVARTTMIRRAFEVISDIPTRLICFSDDVDGMRKVPENVPNQDMLRQYMQMPLTSVPDPYGEFDSFGAHNNAMLRRFLDTFGFEYEFISAPNSTSRASSMRRCCWRANAMTRSWRSCWQSLREERQQTYSCFLPIHPETGRVLYVPMKEVNAKDGTITFDDETGKEWTLPVTGGNVKLQWKPDFGARWAALGCGFRDVWQGPQHQHARSMTGFARCWAAASRTIFSYELFLDDQGQKISKSKGNGLTIDEWLTYAATESLSYFMYQKPKTAKRMHFDVIPRAVDEYHQQLRAYADAGCGGAGQQPGLAYPWRAGAGQPYGGDVRDAVEPRLGCRGHGCGGAVGVHQEICAGGQPRGEPRSGRGGGLCGALFRGQDRADAGVPAAVRQGAGGDGGSAGAVGGLGSGREDDDSLQTMVFAVGKEHGFEPLRDWFKALYEVLLGASDGPRFGGFVALYGVPETVALIDRALGGRDWWPDAISRHRRSRVWAGRRNQGRRCAG